VKKQKSIPFEFILEKLDVLTPVIKPMFGCYAIYIGEKIVLMLRKKEKNDPDNGVWIALSAEHREAIKKIFPSLRPITLFEGKILDWQNLHEDADDFEETVLEACELILKHDQRIGKIPGSKKKKKR
jgi:hypothetical protein